MLHDMEVKQVLVVEDEPNIARICVRTLMPEGFQVEVAVNGEVGLDMWLKKVYDLCISDVRTPRMSGMELFQRVISEYPNADRKFIFTTGDVLSSNVKEFLEKTGRPYLSKPFTPKNLRDIVQKCITAESQIQLR
jgi:CheY-like chemotaxis protein